MSGTRRVVAATWLVLPMLLPLSLPLFVASCGGGAGGDSPVAPAAAVPQPQVLTKLSIALPATTLQASRVVQAAVVALDQHAAVMTVGIPAWASSRPDIASVSADGFVSAWAPGQAVITAGVGDVQGQVTVTVTPPPSPLPVADVTLDPPSAVMETGRTLQLTATPRDFLGNALDGRAVTWSSSTPQVATVSATGLVTAIATGTAIIEAVSESQHGAASLAVAAASDPDIHVSIAAPVPNYVSGDTLGVVATVSSTFQITGVVASAGGISLPLVAGPIGALGNGVGWTGTLHLETLAYGPYTLLVAATDSRGKVGTLTLAFARNPKFSGGSKGPTSNK